MHRSMMSTWPAAGLPLQIWAEAFSNLGRRDWIILRQVCRAFNDIGAKLLFSSIRIFLFDNQGCFDLLPDEEFPALPHHHDEKVVLQAERLSTRSWEILDYLTRNPKFAILIHTLTIYAFFTTPGIFERLCLANAIRKLPRLSTFRWLSGSAHLPNFVMESLPIHLESLLVTRGSHETLALLSRLRHLRELVIHASLSSLQEVFRDVMANNTNELRRLCLPSNLWALLPIRLFDNLTDLHMDRVPSPENVELDLNFALRHTAHLKSLSLPFGTMDQEREIIAALHDNGDTLTNIVSLQLRFHQQVPTSDEDRLFQFIRERRKLQRLYLECVQPNDPSYCRKISLLFKQLPNLRVLGLDPCQPILLSPTENFQCSLFDILPPRLKAFHAKLEELPFSEHGLATLRGLGNFYHLTYLNLSLADPYQLLPFEPAELAVDNPHLQLLGLNDDVYDVRAGISITKWPAWKRILALPEDFEDEDHWWLNSISQALRCTEISLPVQ